MYWFGGLFGSERPGIENIGAPPRVPVTAATAPPPKSPLLFVAAGVALLYLGQHFVKG